MAKEGSLTSAQASGSRPSPARRRRRRKSRIAPALVLLTAAGSATVAGYVLFWRPPVEEDDAGPGAITAENLTSIGAGLGAQITLNNRETGRREATIEYEQWDPVGQGRYDAVQPRAWVYLKSGEYVFLRADSGRFNAPDEQRPQSGVLRGNVVVRVFDASAERPSEDAPCAAEFRLASVSFDTEYGAIWRDRDPAAPDERVVIRTFARGADGVRVREPEIEFVSHDLRVVVNQVQERIERLECRRGERLTYTPAAGASTGGDVGGAPSAGAAEQGTGWPSPGVGGARLVRMSQPVSPGVGGEGDGAGSAGDGARAPARRRAAASAVVYRARFERDVRLTQGDVSASGEILDVWARTVEGRLPEGAIGGPFDPGAGPQARARGHADAGRGASVAEELRGLLVGVAIGAGADRWPPITPEPGGGSGRDAAAAVGGGVTSAGAEPTSSGAAGGAVGVEAMDEGAGADRDAAALGVGRDEPVTLRWDGPLDLVPLRDEPVELEREHVLARLTGGTSGGVRVLDAASGADGLCATLDYGFTSGRLVASGLGESGTRFALAGGEPAAEDAPAGVDGEGSSPDGGTLRAARVEYATGTGVGRVPGGGTLESGPLRRIAWTEQMDFVLATRGEEVLSTLQDVFFRGGVVAEDDTASLRGGFAHAAFTVDESGESVLSSLTLEERGELRGREDERLSAGDTIRIEFERDGEGRTQPTWFSAGGGVLATRPGDRLRAGAMEATLAPGADGRAEITRFEASGGVDLQSRTQGVEVAGRRLSADVPAQRLHVRGTVEEPARVMRGPTTIGGVDVRLFGAPAEARVVGAGSFRHKDAAPEGAERADATFAAAWTQGMRFDDASGELRAVGDVDASLTEGATRVDRLAAWTVEATLDPGAAGPAEGETPGEAAVDGALPGPSRRLRTLAAIGSLADSPDGEPAFIELRRFAPVGAAGGEAGSEGGAVGPVLRQLLYLEGARIDIDNERGLLDVPGWGRLLVADRREPESERPAGSSALSGGGVRGDALFEWQGSLHVDRGQGRMTMTDRVTMVHRRMGDDLVTMLEAPVLTARASGGGVGERAEEAGRLAAVHAEGGVRVVSGDKEITADVVDYDADTGIVTAYSPTGGSVRVLENGAVWTATAIRWDTIGGRIETTSIGGGATPR